MANTQLTRRILFASVGAALCLPNATLPENEIVRVAKSPTCGCCGAWVDHMRQAGFQVEVQDLEYDTLQRLKTHLGISPRHASCHTAQVAGYVIEGHVPATDVARLLKERPSAIGLAVPGMPIGSPGMEMGDQRERYDVVLLKPQGRNEVFQSYR